MGLGLRGTQGVAIAPSAMRATVYGLESGAVDVLQADATRCCGFTGFLEAAHIASCFGFPLSAHCAPSLHMHVGCAVPGLRHVEYFHDHVRIERMLFDGFTSFAMNVA